MGTARHRSVTVRRAGQHLAVIRHSVEVEIATLRVHKAIEGAFRGRFSGDVGLGGTRTGDTAERRSGRV